MTRLATRRLHQKAVLWSNTGKNNYGEVTVGTATEINVRWEETQSDITDANGQTVAVTAEVAVDREITVGSIMWEGAEADLPDAPTNLKQVLSYQEVPDIKGRTFRRIVLLGKYGNTLPDST